MNTFDQEFLETMMGARDVVSAACSHYGLYGTVIYYNPSPIPEGDRNRWYILAGTNPDILEDPLPCYIEPENLLRRQERNPALFYPDLFVVDLYKDTNQMKAMEKLVQYCKCTEFLKSIYNEYSTPLPDRLWISEINQLQKFKDSADNYDLDASVRSKCRKDLEWFFRREKSTGFRRRWLDYFRSERFPQDKGFFARISGYLSRDSQQTTLDRLTEDNDDLSKLEMQEHEFRAFKKNMKLFYPDVTYAVGKKTVVDHGIALARKNAGAEEVFGKNVTGEEYACIAKDRFAKEGWDALKDLQPAYWEFRDIYYKDVDEPLIAHIYNMTLLSYAKPDLVQDLDLSPLHVVNVPRSDFMNFVALAKANGLKFAIDGRGDYSIPSLEFIHVVYQEHQAEKLQGILERIVGDKITCSHLVGSGFGVFDPCPSAPEQPENIQPSPEQSPAEDPTFFDGEVDLPF